VTTENKDPVTRKGHNNVRNKVIKRINIFRSSGTTYYTKLKGKGTDIDVSRERQFAPAVNSDINLSRKKNISLLAQLTPHFTP
jgi:hypothetical protein